MTEYYFDIETYSPEQKPNPDSDKIISIQFQQIDLKTGKPISDLKILKEWKSSEKEIVTKFYNLFFKNQTSKWNFIPVGNALAFEWEFLICKFEKYIGVKLCSRDLHFNIPQIDIQSLIVLLNGGRFSGASLENFIGKSHSGSQIKLWYEKNEFNEIEKYIIDETTKFLEFLQRIMENIDHFKEVLCI